MKAEELRLGNWYQWYAEGKYYYGQIQAKDFVSDYILNFEPIPLSEEVLLKCGCNISPLVTGLRYKHLYRLVWDDEFKYWDILQGEYGYFITRIQYLHEWQNFIHILNGEEMEVSL